MDGVAYLINAVLVGEDAKGQKKYREEQREIFVSSESVTRNEFFSASTKGLSPDILLKTAKINYNGEESLIFEGKRYSVYRTFLNDDDEMELYLERRRSDV